LRHIHSKALQYARYLTVNMRLNFPLSTAMRPNARISCAKTGSGLSKLKFKKHRDFTQNRHPREGGGPSPADEI
jgi:hypothetical protein